MISELKKLQDLLISFLGEPKHESGEDGQLQFNCPRCAENKGHNEYGKYNLECNIVKQVFQCWSCCNVDTEMRGPLIKLIAKYGGKELVKEYKEIINEIIESKYYDISLFKNVNGTSIDDDILLLPKTFTKINLDTLRNKRLKEYLEKRKITQDIIDRYNLGYTTYNEEKPSMRGRLIIPSYNDIGDLNYWVGRDFTGYPKRMKYWNSNTNKQNILYQESHINWYGDIILVEGAIDALYYNGNVIGLLGKSLSKNSETYRKIYEKSKGKIIICLDGDTDIIETKKLYNLLNIGRLRGRIWYIRMDKYKDFGELYENEGKEGIINAVKNKKQFSEIELLY